MLAANRSYFGITLDRVPDHRDIRRLTRSRSGELSGSRIFLRRFGPSRRAVFGFDDTRSCESEEQLFRLLAIDDRLPGAVQLLEDAVPQASGDDLETGAVQAG